MKPEFARCAEGARQSPINIRGGIQVELEPIRFDYRPVNFSVLDTGHTVRVEPAPGNALSVMGRRYELVEFHFHRPAEERIDGRQFDMSLHMVHRDPEGRQAVVAVLLDRGTQPHDGIQRIWNSLPLDR
ncbi:MAG: carbonic anhydrase family protein, partial [bacterium]